MIIIRRASTADGILWARCLTGRGMVSIDEVVATAPTRRILIVSTHPAQSTGYSKVSYNLLKHLGKMNDIEVVHYGFQNFDHVESVERLKSIPPSVIIHDAARAEVPKEQGFGFKGFRDFVRLARPGGIGPIPSSSKARIGR